MSNQEDPLLSKISLLIAHFIAQSTASSQQYIHDAFIDISIIMYTLSLLSAIYPRCLHRRLHYHVYAQSPLRVLEKVIKFVRAA